MITWRRERLHTPIFWPGEFHGLCSTWGHKESDRTEQLSISPVLSLLRVELGGLLTGVLTGQPGVWAARTLLKILQ